MFLTRRIGSFLRGKATRGQVFTAALLGGVLGFVPGFILPSDLGGGFAQAPGLILLLLFLVLVMNANLGVFALATAVSKLLSLLLLPVSFAVGQALIDGPMQPLFVFLANAPVTAWFGFEYYATTGGLVLGTFLGVGMGMLMVRTLMQFRHRMARVEEQSERYQRHANRPYTRFMAWVLFGKGKGKKLSWQELSDADRRAKPVRVLGVALVVLVTAGIWVFQSVFSTPLLTDGLRSGLAAVNGATVDLERAELSLSGGSMRITGLALADSSALDTDLFAADVLEADIDVEALLRRRLVIDRLRASGATSGRARTSPGELIVAEAEPEATPEPEPEGTTPARTLEDYVADYETWKGRIEQGREWLVWLAGGDEPAPETPEQQRERVARAIEEYGLANVTAEHLRRELPLIWIRSIDIEGIDSAQLAKKVDLHVTDYSTNAWLLNDPPRLSLRSSDGELAFAFTGPSRAKKGAGVDLQLQKLPVDTVMGEFKIAGTSPLRGGTIDVQVQGGLQTHEGRETTIDLPLQVTLHDTTFALAGGSPTRVEQLLLPIGVHGPVSSLRVKFDDQVLAQALVQAGKRELAQFVQAQGGKLLGSVPGGSDLIDPAKPAGEIIDDATRAAEEAARKAAEEAARKAAEEAARKAAEEAAKKGLGEGLKGLLPGGRKNQ